MKEILTIFASERVVVHVYVQKIGLPSRSHYTVWIECADCGHLSCIAGLHSQELAIEVSIEVRDLIINSDVCHNCLGIRETPNGKLSEWN